MTKSGDQLQKAHLSIHMPCVKGSSSGINRRFRCTEFFKIFQKVFCSKKTPKVSISDNAQTFHCVDKDIQKIAHSEAVKIKVLRKNGVNRLNLVQKAIYLNKKIKSRNK